jgi:hypothetical protein
MKSRDNDNTPGPSQPMQDGSPTATPAIEHARPRDARLNPSPTAESTAYAAHLRRLADQLQRIEASHTDLATTIPTELAPELTALRNETREQLALHHAQIRQLTKAAKTEHNPPPNWPAPNADQASGAWENLRAARQR